MQTDHQSDLIILQIALARHNRQATANGRRAGSNPAGGVGAVGATEPGENPDRSPASADAPENRHRDPLRTPLREGGSLPAIVEGDDEGLYVLKFRGAGQGPKALVAEWVAGEIARALGLNVPEIVFMELDRELARTEPDAEIQDLIRASAGLNLALDYLPGSVTFDPLAGAPDADTASAVVWFDALVSNLDRSPRNSNLLRWHGRPRLIDHGAALYFHHDWGRAADKARAPFAPIADHVLLPFAAALPAADARLAPRVTPALVEAIVAAIPAAWLQDESAFASVAAHRAAYARHVGERLQAPRLFVEEALRARTAHV